MSQLLPAGVNLPALNSEEDSFCLAIIEYAGNIGAAYQAVFGKDVSMPMARGRNMLMRPEIAKRIAELSALVEEHAFVSLGSHLMQLARIRDLAVDNGQLKVALGAEQARGQVAGFYQPKGAQNNPDAPNDGKASVKIFMGSSPASVQEWANSHGKPTVIIEAG